MDEFVENFTEDMGFGKNGKRKKMKKWVLEKMGKGRRRKGYFGNLIQK